MAAFKIEAVEHHALQNVSADDIPDIDDFEDADLLVHDPASLAAAAPSGGSSASTASAAASAPQGAAGGSMMMVCSTSR